MNEHDATEVAYRNGYEAGKRDAVKHGRWIIPTVINGMPFVVPHCSACKGVPCGVNKDTKFCPNCGAKMDLENG